MVGVKCCFRNPVTIRTPLSSWRAKRVLTVSPNACVGCRECEKICPCKAIKITSAGESSWDADKCSFCRLCERNCRFKAITIERDD
ncbi:MAG: 4Fe-4S binding protein [Holosporales bacterium]|nr:4Fe-4S binding protein [Holosporales bacterium]